MGVRPPGITAARLKAKPRRQCVATEAIPHGRHWWRQARQSRLSAWIGQPQQEVESSGSLIAVTPQRNPTAAPKANAAPAASSARGSGSIRKEQGRLRLASTKTEMRRPVPIPYRKSETGRDSPVNMYTKPLTYLLMSLQCSSLMRLCESNPLEGGSFYPIPPFACP